MIVFIIGPFLGLIFTMVYKETYMRYWRIWTPIRFVYDVVWNLKHSKENYGHWVRSNRFGGQCTKCGSMAHGGMYITILFGAATTGCVILTCDDVKNEKIVREMMEA